MPELTRPQILPSAPAASDALEPPSPPGPGVLVQSGVHAHELPVVGRSVADVRQRFAVLLGIDPQAVAIVDGNEVGESHVLRAQQVLTFVRHSGEKGVMPSMRVDGESLVAELPEGVRAALPLDRLVKALLKHAGGLRRELGATIVPDGVRLLAPTSRGLIAVHETPPSVRNLRWISADSPSTHGAGAAFRNVRIALPYVVTLVLFVEASGRLEVQGHCEVYFRNAPLSSTADELLLPALLNCAVPNERVSGVEADSVLCTQHFDRRTIQAEGDPQRQIRAGVAAMLGYLFGAAFNRHIEEVRRVSSFTATVQARVDERLASIEAWEQASLADSWFALDVRWLPASTTLARALERIQQGLAHGVPEVRTATDLARIVFLEGQPTP